MNLVDLLARELDKWPEGMQSAGQDLDSRVWAFSGMTKRGGDQWLMYDKDGNKLEMVCIEKYDIASDHTTSIITSEMWEAERAKLKEGKTVKANKDGWIRHRGGKCPVDVGAEIDLRLRCGEELIPASRRASEWNWKHTVGSRDIMAYRLHKPEQPDVYADDAVAGEPVTVEFVDPVIGQPEGPLSWRDRIHEIDAASKDEEARHCAVMEAFDKERAELVAKLAAEGLALVERAETSPAEDMSDWRNWRVGDLVTVLDSEHEKELMSGKQYPIVELEGDDYDGEMPAQLKNGGCSWLDLDNMMWHSRPTA